MKIYTFNFDKRPFGRLGGVLHFYTIIGLNFSRTSYRNIRINPKSNQQLKQIILRTARFYEPQYKAKFPFGVSVSFQPQQMRAKYAERRAYFDWGNYCPVDDERLPVGMIVMWEVGDMEYIA